MHAKKNCIQHTDRVSFRRYITACNAHTDIQRAQQNRHVEIIFGRMSEEKKDTKAKRRIFNGKCVFFFLSQRVFHAVWRKCKWKHTNKTRSPSIHSHTFRAKLSCACVQCNKWYRRYYLSTHATICFNFVWFAFFSYLQCLPTGKNDDVCECLCVHIVFKYWSRFP